MQETKKRWGNYDLQVPEHVPDDLVQSFRFFDEPGMEKCPFDTILKLRQGKRIFWNVGEKQFGGSWVVTRAEDARYVMSHPELFSSQGSAAFAQLIGEDWKMIPIELDPPVHTKFRQFLNQFFSPSAVQKLSGDIANHCVSLVEGIKPKGECEFIGEFAFKFPNGVFARLLGLSAETRDTVTDWVGVIMHTPDFAEKAGSVKILRDFVVDLVTRLRAHPTQDLSSTIANAELDGRTVTFDEAVGMLYLLFVGAFDTVGSTLGFLFRFLAENPSYQDDLRANPQKIGKAVDELLRRFSVVTARRVCTQDVEIAGVKMKKGDWIMAPGSLASMDPTEFPSPDTVDFDRKNKRHFAFQSGPHFCLGAHLAKRELEVALYEWLTRVPAWHVKPGAPVLARGGVFGLDHLELQWNA
jgi:cytochrome P450